MEPAAQKPLVHSHMWLLHSFSIRNSQENISTHLLLLLTEGFASKEIVLILGYMQPWMHPQSQHLLLYV